ncbi:MAG: DUF4365 domain-containing protein [Proteobacteria bacterium]|nr:DUF4365 domain-containing protein [Pseudomonadota bacterium]MBU4289216.1 DUF4365 domain-containing protein [Pseudomonadota bacterium]MCG2830253.1 DUF4365 domain-containing protein [Desulfobacteraceae bacterium]
MTDKDYKQYTKDARKGIKGEAFFESLIVEHAIPHRIARHNDLGVDFLCEWISGDRPTGLLFSVQIKTTTYSTIKTQFKELSKLNGLNKYKLSGAQKVDDRTLNYWKGLGIPAFLFYIIEDSSKSINDLECFYKRYTPLLDGHSKPEDESGTLAFYRVNEGATFLAFSDSEQEIGGFARDLIIDYFRLSYSKGHVIPLTPSKFGFWPFENKHNSDSLIYFRDFLQWYKKAIKDTCEQTTALLANLPNQE